MAINNIEVEAAGKLNELAARFDLEPNHFLAEIDIMPGGKTVIGAEKQSITFHGLTFSGQLHQKEKPLARLLEALGVAPRKAEEGSKKGAQTIIELNENKSIIFSLNEALKNVPPTDRDWVRRVP